MLDVPRYSIPNAGVFQSRWTGERLEELKRLVLIERLSARQAADRMSVTRNSVIGAVHRHGITLARSTGCHAPPGETAPPRKCKPRSSYGIRQPLFTADPVTLRAVPTESLNIPFAELNERTDCKFPTSDGSPYFFCGIKRIEDSPYCFEHHKICYSPRRAA